MQNFEERHRGILMESKMRAWLKSAVCFYFVSHIAGAVGKLEPLPVFYQVCLQRQVWCILIQRRSFCSMAKADMAKSVIRLDILLAFAGQKSLLPAGLSSGYSAKPLYDSFCPAGTVAVCPGLLTAPTSCSALGTGYSEIKTGIVEALLAAQCCCYGGTSFTSG